MWTGTKEGGTTISLNAKWEYQVPAEYRKTIEIKEHTFTKTLRKMCLLLLPRLTRCRLHLQGQNGIEYSGYQLPLHLLLWPSSPSFSLVYSPKGNNPLSPTASVLSSFSLFQFKLHNYPKP